MFTMEKQNNEMGYCVVCELLLTSLKLDMIDQSNTVPSTNIGTLDKYEQRRLWK